MNALLRVVMFVVCSSCLATALAEPPASVQEQLRPRLEEMLQAANAHDTERFMSVYVHRPSLAVPFDETTLHGWQAIRDQPLRGWDNGKSDAVYRLAAAPEITEISPDGVATLQSMEVAGTAPNGQKTIFKVIVTSVWKRLAAGWRIVLAQASIVH